MCEVVVSIDELKIAQAENPQLNDYINKKMYNRRRPFIRIFKNKIVANGLSLMFPLVSTFTTFGTFATFAITTFAITTFAITTFAASAR